MSDQDENSDATLVEEPCVPEPPSSTTNVESAEITFRDLRFEDLESYKRLLHFFPHGFVGILFKDICDNECGEYYAHAAFHGHHMVGMIVGVRDFAKVRQFTEIESGLAAMTGKKLAYVVAVVVDPEHRRQDIGTKLVDGFKAFAGDQTAKFMFIPHNNVIAQQFFEHQNFGAISTLRKFYSEFEDSLLFVDNISRSQK